MTATPVSFAPDLDTAWSVNPGALTNVEYLAPLQNGAYASMAKSTQFALTGTDVFMAKTFRQVSGAVRLLVFRTQNIDEYDNAGTRTNRGTSYSGSTTDWDAAAWGNQIIAVNYLDAPQSSTGAGFSSLSGSPPKARRIAANINFVMLADVDDGGSNVYSDMVWWSALRDPSSWTPSLATQAGNVRLLDSPGPIRSLVAYRDMFVAFKDNAIFVGQYVGPQQYVFSWRMISNRVGCVAPHGVAEVDGKLYFTHTSGFYEFDGQAIRNVGTPVFKTAMYEMGLGGAVPGVGSDISSPTNSSTSLIYTQCCADEVDGVVWFGMHGTSTGPGQNYLFMYGYNVRSQKWGHMGAGSSSGINGNGGNPAVLLQSSLADLTGFFTAAVASDIRFMAIPQTTSPVLQAWKYPAAATECAVYTGVFGAKEQSSDVIRVWPRMLYGSNASAWGSSSVSGYTDEAKTITNGTAGLTTNTEFDCLDGRISSKYRKLSLGQLTSKIVILSGLDIEGVPSRR